MTNWIQRLLNRLGLPVGASVSADIATAQADLTTLLTRLSAARAGYLDQLDFALQEAIAALQTDLDNPAQYKADLTTLETRLSAARAGYLDELNFDLQGTLGTIAAYIDTEVAAVLAAVDTEVAAILADVTGIAGAAMRGTDNAALAANWTAALATALAAYTAARGAYLDQLDFNLQEKLTEIDAEVEGIGGVAMRGTDNAALAAAWTAALATALGNYTAARAAYLDELAAANIPADIDTLLTRVTAAVALASALTTHDTDIKGLLATIQTDLDNPNQYKANVAALALEASLGTHDTDIKALLATIAGYLDTEIAAILADVTGIAGAAMRGTDGAALAASWTAALATILGNFSAARIGYLDELDFDLAAAIAAIPTTMVGTNNAALAANWTAALATALANYTAVRAGYLDELAAANIPADIDELKASKGRLLQSMDFWSDPKEEVQLDGDVAATIALGTVNIADLPSGATIVRAIAMFKFRMVENAHATIANKLDGATVANTSQVIQVADDTPGTYYDAIKFVDDQFGIAAETREGGDVLIGSVDIAGAGKVDAIDGYLFRWLLALADEDYLQFNDVQCGLRIWYSV